MNICVIGTGAVGGFFGALLAKSGNNVTFVSRGESAEVISSRGLLIKNPTEDILIHPTKVITNPENLSQVDLILVAVKSYDLPNIAKYLNNIPPQTTVITLQNGIDSDLLVKKLVPRLNVHPALVYVSATKISSGIIFQSGPQKTLIFGRRDNKPDGKLSQVEKVLKSAGIDAVLSANIQEDLWKKFIFVISFAAVTVRFKTDIGTALSTPHMREFYEQSLAEVIAVARAEGVEIDNNFFKQTIKKALLFPPTTKSSMLVDIENGRLTEKETLHATLLNLAQKHHLPAPANSEVLDYV